MDGDSSEDPEYCDRKRAQLHTNAGGRVGQCKPDRNLLYFSDADEVLYSVYLCIPIGRK